MVEFERRATAPKGQASLTRRNFFFSLNDPQMASAPLKLNLHIVEKDQDNFVKSGAIFQAVEMSWGQRAETRD
jgi:hypothetical protein